jgi:hypothetical protein
LRVPGAYCTAWSRPLHGAAKNGGLFGHEQRGKGQAADEHDVLGAVAEEHFEREVEHRFWFS